LLVEEIVEKYTRGKCSHNSCQAGSVGQPRQKKCEDAARDQFHVVHSCARKSLREPRRDPETNHDRATEKNCRFRCCPNDIRESDAPGARAPGLSRENPGAKYIVETCRTENDACFITFLLP